MMEYNAILQYWFPNNNFNNFWFSGEKTDEYIKNNFYDYFSELTKENPVIFINQDELLAKIIVLDQFTRNINRDSSRAYQNDSKALELAELYFLKNYDKKHTFNKIIFALMPFRHSEKISNQKFVLDYLQGVDDKDTILYKKFYRESLISHNTIKKYGKFIHRIY